MTKRISLAGVALLALLAAANVQAATFTAQDVTAHNTAASCWTIVNSKVYDLTTYIASSSHPGGNAAIISLCGIDGTAAFTAKHGSSTAANTALSNQFIGDLAVAPVVDTAKPSTPTGLSGTVTTSSVALSWTAATDNVAVIGYNVMRGTSTVATTSQKQYTDSGLAASTSYTYSVSAFDAAGNNSSSSAELTINTAQPTPVTTSTATSTPKKRLKFKGNVDSFAKVINIRSNELVKIYIYGDATLDPTQIDMKTVKLAGASAVQLVLRDLNRDKKIDTIASFRAKQMTEFNNATSSVTTAKLVFATKDGKTYEQVIKVRVKHWKTEKQRKEEKRKEELKKKLEKQKEMIKKEAEKKREALKQTVEKKKEALKKEAEKKREALKQSAEKKAEQIKGWEGKKNEQLKKLETKK
jgi:cytochrome b involved in lipid metabolism